jgi:molecular chaperone IbpA
MLLRKEDVEMRTDFDFSPLFRTTVGFDRMLDALRSAMQVEHLDGFPPYDIERLGDDRYRITLAVAGFAPEELSVTAHPNLLVVAGERRMAGNGEGSAQRQVLHRGIAARAFERRFELADHVQVTGARLTDGLLTIELHRELPEAMRPRRIAIGQGDTPQRPQIEGEAEETRAAA